MGGDSVDIDWKKTVTSLAADILGIRARAAEKGREEEMYPEPEEMFLPDQFMKIENLKGLFSRMRPYAPCLIRDRLTFCWAALSLDGFSILAGPFATQVLTWNETAAILRSLKADMGLLDDLNRYVVFSRLVGVEQVEALLRAYCHLFAGRDPERTRTLDLLPGDPLKLPEEDPHKYAEHYQDMEAAYSAAIAHGNLKSALEILNDLQRPYLDLPEDETGSALRDISGFTTQLTFARIAARRAGVPAGALEAAFRTYRDRAIRARSHQRLLQLSYDATRAFCELVNRNSRHTYSANVRNAVDYMERNFREPITLRAVADHLGVNASALSKAFHRETGRTFTEHLNRVRLENARILMAMNDFVIRDICAASGIPDQSYFTRLFHQMYGITPQEYRRELIGRDRPAGEQASDRQ